VPRSEVNKVWVDRAGPVRSGNSINRHLVGKEICFSHCFSLEQTAEPFFPYGKAFNKQKRINEKLFLYFAVFAAGRHEGNSTFASEFKTIRA